MLEELNHSGYIVIKRTCELCNNTQDVNGDNVSAEMKKIECRYAYEYTDGFIYIYAYEDIPEISGNSVIIGTGFDRNNYLFFSSSKISNNWPNTSPKRIKIDYIVKGYEKDAIYTEAFFSFDELQYFCPSVAVVKEDPDHNVTFLSERKEIKTFNVIVDFIKCRVSFRLRAEGKGEFAKSHMTAFTDITISFPETSDYDFLKKIYLMVDMAFAFICNRRNTTCLSMKLIGEHKGVIFQNWQSVEKKLPFTCEIYYYDSYRDEPENHDVIKNTWWANGFFEHIDNLFDLIAKDLSGISDDKGRGTISIESVHPSLKSRRKIDLQLSLQIASAFEFYIRKYLPDMVKEKEYHKEIKQVLENIVENSSGDKKKLAKNLMKHVLVEPALEDKVWKVYNGYDEWKPIRPCISEEWFKDVEIKELGSEMNQWRNDLAHSKREYIPNSNTIRAVRLIEHLNYAIVLRKIGYDDNEIKDILSHVLLHERFDV